MEVLTADIVIIALIVFLVMAAVALSNINKTVRNTERIL
jgi:hypothetical protein